MAKGGKNKKVKVTGTAVAEPEAAAEAVEALDEAQATEKPAKKAKKVKEAVERTGMNTKEAAALLGVTPVKLRRILRTADFFNDNAYSRYDLDDATIERLRAAIAAGVDGSNRKPRGKKNAEVEEEAEDVESAVAEIESSEEEEDLEDLDLADDEEEEEEEDEDDE